MKKSTPIQFLYRVATYCLGLLLMALGVAFSVNSNLGVSPVNSLPYVISLILRLPMGSCVTAVFCFYILLQFLLLGKSFHPVNFLQILFSTVFGYFVDFAKTIAGDITAATYFGQLSLLAVSIVLIALGVLLYMEAELVPMPMEGLSSTIARKMNVPFPTMKTVIDCIVVLTGAVLSFVLLGELTGIREGTVITAVVTGKLIALFRKPLHPVIQRICFGE